MAVGTTTATLKKAEKTGAAGERDCGSNIESSERFTLVCPMNISIWTLRSCLGLTLFLSMTALVRASSADTAFEKIARASIEELLIRNPEAATTLGDHRFDDRLTDYSPEARAASEKSLRSQLAELRQ